MFILRSVITINTITICGSMKFSEQMKKIAWRLESEQGFNVLQCVYYDGNEPLSDKTKRHLALAHYRKIDLSEAVYIVDIDGYIGTAVQDEIEYAKRNGKEVIYHSKQHS